MAMNPLFADWYRAAGITPSEEELAKRWSAIEAISKKPSAGLVIKAARLFCVPIRKSDIAPELVDAFRSRDETFPLRENDQLLKVLAGAFLRNVIESDNDMSAVAAMAVTCGAFGDRFSVLPERDHLVVAEHRLLALARKKREPKTFISVKPISLSKTRLPEMLPANL